MNNPFDVIMEKLNEMDNKISSMPAAIAATPPEIINTEELCKRLDISEPTAIKWRRKKKIPSFTIGSAVRYNWPAVVEFLQTKSPGK
jgi:hypothetical protein